MWRLLVHGVVFWLLLPVYGSSMLPWFDHPLWHDDLARAAEDLSSFQTVNARLAMHGRFMPGFVLLHGLSLRCNESPQIASWLLLMGAAQLAAAGMFTLLFDVTGSPRLACLGCLLLVATPQVQSTFALSMFSEPLQLPFVVAFLMFAHRLVESPRWLGPLAGAGVCLLGALCVKETAVFLSVGSVAWACLLVAMRHPRRPRAAALAAVALAVSLLWWLARWACLGPAMEGYPRAILALGGLSVVKRAVIWAVEILVALPSLAIVLPWAGWRLLALRAGPGRLANRPSPPPLPPVLGLVASSLAAWWLGQSLFSQILIRYSVPLLALGAILATALVPCLPDQRLRAVHGVLLVVGLTSNAASAVSVRGLDSQLLRCQEEAVRRLAALEPQTTVLVAVPEPADPAVYAAALDWIVKRFTTRTDLDFRAADAANLAEPGPGTVLFSMQSNLAGVIDHHPGGLARSPAPRHAPPEACIRAEVQGWFVRGVDLLLWVKRRVAPSHEEELRAPGWTHLKLEFRLERMRRAAAGAGVMRHGRPQLGRLPHDPRATAGLHDVADWVMFEA